MMKHRLHIEVRQHNLFYLVLSFDGMLKEWNINDSRLSPFDIEAEIIEDMGPDVHDFINAETDFSLAKSLQVMVKNRTEWNVIDCTKGCSGVITSNGYIIAHE